MNEAAGSLNNDSNLHHHWIGSKRRVIGEAKDDWTNFAQKLNSAGPLIIKPSKTPQLMLDKRTNNATDIIIDDDDGKGETIQEPSMYDDSL